MATVSFEKSLKQLETIVQELEGGELPLERALKKFEEGMRLSKLCAAKLDETERRVALLMQDGEGQRRRKNRSHTIRRSNRCPAVQTMNDDHRQPGKDAPGNFDLNPYLQDRRGLIQLPAGANATPPIPTIAWLGAMRPFPSGRGVNEFDPCCAWRLPRR